MKKLIATLFAAVLMATGLAALSSGTTANAACPYTGCIATHVVVKAPKYVRTNTSGVSAIDVRPGAPVGQFKIVLKRDAGGYYSKIFKSATSNSTTTAKLKLKGKYTLTVTYIPRDGSAYAKSGSSDSFTVIKKGSRK